MTRARRTDPGLISLGYFVKIPRRPVLERGKPVRYVLPMPMTLDEIEKEALALPSEARARLADRLVESLENAEANRIDEDNRRHSAIFNRAADCVWSVRHLR